MQRHIGARETSETGKPKHSGGKSRYVFSGLLVCGECGSNFVLSNRLSYACAGRTGGIPCKNTITLPRDVVQDKILGPLQKQLLEPAAVAEFAKDMQSYYRNLLRQQSAKDGEVPDQVKDLDAHGSPS
ncbi:MAG: zinc ribbon domain-containing protein [Terriglobales bacterium]